MCLAIPVEIIELKEDGTAIASADNIKKEISVQFLPDIKIGEFVLLHAGFAIQRIDKQKAEETLNLLREVQGQ